VPSYVDGMRLAREPWFLSLIVTQSVRINSKIVVNVNCENRICRARFDEVALQFGSHGWNTIEGDGAIQSRRDRLSRTASPGARG
jgi:hypothetical protein